MADKKENLYAVVGVQKNIARGHSLYIDPSVANFNIIVGEEKLVSCMKRDAAFVDVEEGYDNTYFHFPSWKPVKSYNIKVT